MKTYSNIICLICLTAVLSCNSNSDNGIYENHFGMQIFEPYDSKVLFLTFDKDSISLWDWVFDYSEHYKSESYPIPCISTKSIPIILSHNMMIRLGIVFFLIVHQNITFLTALEK